MTQAWKKGSLACLTVVIFTILLLSGGLSASPLAVSAAVNVQSPGIEILLQQGSDKAAVNGKEMKVQGMYETKGVTMMPINTLLRAFELSIDFSKDRQSFTLSSKSYRFYHAEVKLGALEAHLGQSDAALKLPQPVVEKQGSIMVPLRAFAESLGAVVKYDSKKKTIHITRAADILVDSKQRIGSSKAGWSIAAPLLEPSEPYWEEYTGGWSWNGVPYANAAGRFYVTVRTGDGGAALTEEEAWEQLTNSLHPAWVPIEKRTLKTKAGQFIGLVTSHNEAFSVSYTQYWLLRLPDKTYYIEITQSNADTAAERNWVANKLLPTFRAAFNQEDGIIKDVDLLQP